MAKQPTKKTASKKVATKKTPAQKSVAKKVAIAQPIAEREKNTFEKNFGEGTAFDLDYGKLLIIALCIYIAGSVK